jgi:hypothetical protein
VALLSAPAPTQTLLSFDALFQRQARSWSLNCMGKRETTILLVLCMRLQGLTARATFFVFDQNSCKRCLLSNPPNPNRYRRAIFFSSLFLGNVTPEQREDAADFLCEQFERATAVESDLPHKMADLEGWMHASVEAVGREYHQYLEERKAGGLRRYFENKAHALHFLKAVAPTKLVDGAWLYGTLEKCKTRVSLRSFARTLKN